MLSLNTVGVEDSQPPALGVWSLNHFCSLACISYKLDHTVVRGKQWLGHFSLQLDMF